MALALILEFPHVTQTQYEMALEALGGDPRAHGAQVHVAGPMEGGWRVVEVWPSQEAVEGFFGSETAQRAFQKAWIPPVQPTVFPVHRLVTL
jgi:quinol monooxygenase YgiN